jgi:hypothetical protein
MGVGGSIRLYAEEKVCSKNNLLLIAYRRGEVESQRDTMSPGGTRSIQTRRSGDGDRLGWIRFA